MTDIEIRAVPIFNKILNFPPSFYNKTPFCFLSFYNETVNMVVKNLSYYQNNLQGSKLNDSREAKIKN